MLLHRKYMAFNRKQILLRLGISSLPLVVCIGFLTYHIAVGDKLNWLMNAVILISGIGVEFLALTLTYRYQTKSIGATLPKVDRLH